MGLTCCHKTTVFYIYVCFFTSIYSRDTNIPILKTNGRYLRFRFWPYCHHRHVIWHRPQTTGDWVVTSCRPPRWPQRRHKSTSAFSFGDVSRLRTSKSIRIPNFANIAQSAAEILLFPVSEKKRSLYWNSTSVFLCRFRRHWHVILGRHIKFYPNRTSAAELWRHGDFQGGGRHVARLLQVSAFVRHCN